ncbi:MAG: hypothetical protein DWP95_10305 [Proteobacteria bacterium]|nr:MAG: hypothetical protein DWP95_10305 [Pseudomonadota bacterium]
MRKEYKQLWDNQYGSNPVKDDRLTSVAQNWVNTLGKLDAGLIRLGLDNLHVRSNPGFPPNPSEFVALCYEMSFEPVIDEIFDYINRKSDDFEWTSQLAYNVFIKMQYDKLKGESSGVLYKRAERIHRAIDRSDLVPVPDPVKQIEQKPLSDVERKLNEFRLKINCQFMKSKVATGVIGDRIDNHELKQWMVEWYEQGRPNIGDFLKGKGVKL